MACESRGPQRNTAEFIALYRSLPCLWKVRSKEYGNKRQRDAAYMMLLRKLKEVYPDADKTQVTKKINSLRSCFRKEYKKVVISRKSGEATLYKPNLWYFDSLMFLKEGNEGNEVLPDSVEFIELNQNTEDPLAAADCDDQDDNNDIDNNDDEYMESERQTPDFLYNSQCTLSSPPNTDRKRKSLTNNNTQEVLTLVAKKLKPPKVDDEYDLIGKNVSEKLRKLSPVMKIFAEKIINEALFEAQLDSLTRYAYIKIPTGDEKR